MRHSAALIQLGEIMLYGLAIGLVVVGFLIFVAIKMGPKFIIVTLLKWACYATTIVSFWVAFAMIMSGPITAVFIVPIVAGLIWLSWKLRSIQHDI